MKKMVSAFLCILFCAYLLCGCSVHKKNVVYFGYFNGDEKNQSGEYYTEELNQTNHANIVFVSNNDAVTEAWKNRLEMVLNFPEEVFSTQEDGSLYLSTFWKARYRQYALPLLGDYLTGICLDHPYSRGLSAEDLKLLAKTLQTDSAKSKLVIWENAEKIPELNQYLANLYDDEALEEHVILMAEFSQTPTRTQIREVTQAAQSIPVWIKAPNSSVSEVYNWPLMYRGSLQKMPAKSATTIFKSGKKSYWNIRVRVIKLRIRNTLVITVLQAMRLVRTTWMKSAPCIIAMLLLLLLI